MAICVLGGSRPVQAQIYLSKDANGVLVLSDKPPAGVSAARVAPAATARTGLPQILNVGRNYEPIIQHHSVMQGIRAELIRALIQVESAFNPRAVSPKGAMGLMQLMPGTALMHGVRNIHEPFQNIVGGVQHLRMLLDRYSNNVVLALAAYNAGEGSVDQYGGIPPFEETRNYVHRVLQFRQDYLQQAIASTR